tara:strand:- start:64 stop:537 length:474 start_codon:yes stop_codon:yes gene_type:complete
MKNIQISTDEINFFKGYYKEEPHSWYNPMFISPNDWPPPQDWLNEPPHLQHKVKEKRGAVCLCVWEKFQQATNRSLIDYFKLIIPHVHLPLDLDSFMNIIDGRHRLIAYKELDIMCPVYIGRKRVRYGYCWRDGVAYYDETIDMTVKNRNGYYALVK